MLESVVGNSVLEAGAAVIAVQALAAASVLTAGRHEARLRRGLPYVVSGAVGVLLATGAAHLLPEAIHALGNRPSVWITLVATIVVLFTFERAVHRLSGVPAEPSADLAEQECEEIHAHSHAHGAAKPSALLLGAFTHSLVDGASIAAAFAADRTLGWITTLAVGLHEVPHRLGDFALLLHMELKPRRAAMLAIGAGFSSLLGWGLVAVLGAAAPGWVAWLLPVSAGSFLYISLFDLLPEILSERRPARVLGQVVAFVFGALLAIGLTSLPGA
jgi:zinc and cadmium transporter